jgi:hypothetical protein
MTHPDPRLRGAAERGAAERAAEPGVDQDFGADDRASTGWIRSPDPLIDASSRGAATDEPRGPEPTGEPASIVSGRVGTWDEAAIVRSALLDAGFRADDIEVFYTGPAGRHAVTPIGGDAQADAGAVEAGKGAATGGALGSAAGLAIGAAVATAPVTGPVLLTAAALGAFGGALVGGVAATEDGSNKSDSAEHPVAKPGGVVIAVRTDGDITVADGPGAADARAVKCLNDGGAVALERAHGHWLEGRWVDWDPVAPREQIAPEPGTPQA